MWQISDGVVGVLAGYHCLPLTPHRALGSLHAELHADCLEETVANHLISILASTVPHLQQHGAEQNAVKRGQIQLW